MNNKLGSLFDGSIEWRPIKGYENEYLVSEAGDVWSVRSERKLSLKRERTGYLRVNLSVDGVSKAFSVHRLVAMAFIPNPSNRPTVNHINENKGDNRIGEAARSVNVSTGHIWQCCNGQRKTCKGSVWNYA